VFETYSATQLADELNSVKHYDPYYTGALSLLDEATLRWTGRHPELRAPQQAFATARSRQKRGGISDSDWPNVVSTAETLAQALRPYGNERLQFCGQRSVYGTCHGLVHDGPCPRSSNHVND
jgi:hypothetical protein